MQVRFLPRAQQENTPKGVFSVVSSEHDTGVSCVRNRRDFRFTRTAVRVGNPRFHFNEWRRGENEKDYPAEGKVKSHLLYFFYVFQTQK
jgi:hypothetical protein